MGEAWEPSKKHIPPAPSPEIVEHWIEKYFIFSALTWLHFHSQQIQIQK
jgi:hypothetical protein